MRPLFFLLSVALVLFLPLASGAQSGGQPTAVALHLITADVSPGTMVEFKGMLFFSGYTAAHGAELWRSDGTAEGTVLVKDINPGPAHSNINYLTVSQGQLFFSANNGQLGQELWKSDGTPEGTVLVKDLYPGPPRPGGYFEGIGGPEYLTDFGGALYFSARHPDWGRELFKSDGTAEGTVLVKDINPGPGDNHPLYPYVRSSVPSHLTPLGDWLYFSAYDGMHGVELWRSDGTAEGTQLVLDLYPGRPERATFGPGQYGADPSAMIVYQGMLYFHAMDSLHEGGLWRSDGTAQGTELIKDLDPEGMSFIYSFAVVGPTLFFSANSEAHGYELWKSDGSPEGTVLVKDINTLDSPEQHAKSSYPADLVAYAGELYFSAAEALHGRELWRSSGTAEGTVLVNDLLPGPAGSEPVALTPLGNVLLLWCRCAGGWPGPLCL
ncbi:ELWxxDGT repeat protein [Cesiribacter andamanensis]|uniref:Uncharacterized protein n=1 Tax=Cesiribacter andamanensis AMV16 TaxID=1279009 RepID=M7NRE6_9BACT|nr:ELWxxDGT repeat protein [Cesiribacter andamanensis]EMR01089.1 hypothetical protein ADICEAN_03793 [Cesiribacter andamanensis AMV16]